MKIASAGYLGHVLKMCMSENRTTEIRKSQGLWMYFCTIALKLRFCEKGTKFLQNHHLRFVLYCNGQIYGGDFAKFCGLLRIYMNSNNNHTSHTDQRHHHMQLAEFSNQCTGLGMLPCNETLHLRLHLE